MYMYMYMYNVSYCTEHKYNLNTWALTNWFQTTRIHSCTLSQLKQESKTSIVIHTLSNILCTCMYIFILVHVHLLLYLCTYTFIFKNCRIHACSMYYTCTCTCVHMYMYVQVSMLCTSKTKSITLVILVYSGSQRSPSIDHEAKSLYATLVPKCILMCIHT